MALAEPDVPEGLLACRYLTGAEMLERAKAERKEEEKKNERRNP